ncbi:hypothetical protein A5768_25765 [Mycolicibacterium fortuitum]|nr:hypothetical protein A5768_25765 [Mycolicibacterium fortuitum]
MPARHEESEMTWKVQLSSDELNVVTNARKTSAKQAGDGVFGRDFHLQLARKLALDSDFSGNRRLP